MVLPTTLKPNTPASQFACVGHAYLPLNEEDRTLHRLAIAEGVTVTRLWLMEHLTEGRWQNAVHTVEMGDAATSPSEL